MKNQQPLPPLTEFRESIRSIPPSEIHEFFQLHIQTEVAKIPQAPKDTLTDIQQRIKLYTELENEFLNIKQTTK